VDITRHEGDSNVLLESEFLEFLLASRVISQASFEKHEEQEKRLTSMTQLRSFLCAAAQG